MRTASIKNQKPKIKNPFWTLEEHSIGDVTIIRVEDEYHLFTEQTPLEYEPPLDGKRTVGHAVSKDLFHWEELPTTIGCGPPGSFDAFTIYHMDVFHHEGKFYQYYTGLDISEPGQQQAVGLAISEDGIHWEKHPDNPVLRADPRWYEPAIPKEATYQEKDFRRLWFRDPCIIQEQESGKFGMIVIARDLAHHPDVRGCLAWATSDDLNRWEPHPPIFSPGRFHTIETPSIFERDGRHYIIYMTHQGWGAPPMVTDPYQTAGNFYAISETGWEGPYLPPEDEVLLAAHGQMRMGAQRTVDGPDGERYLYGWLILKPSEDDAQVELKHGMVMPPPRKIRFLDDGRMQPIYNADIESFTSPVEIDTGSVSPLPEEEDHWEVHDGRAIGKHFKTRTISLLPGKYKDFIFSAKVEFLRGERAGLVLRTATDGSRGLQVVADRRYGRVEFGILGSDSFIDARSCTLKDEFELRIIALDYSIEVYLDDSLLIHQVRHREKSGAIGFLVDRGEAQFVSAELLEFE